jgi:O-antigen/teichoic acid export membrane protein
MYFSIAGAIITIVFNIVFIPVIGFMASAYATLITYSFMTIISYVYGKKYYSIPYQIKNIFLYIIFSISLSYFSFLLFRGNILVSILIVILFLGVILWNEKNEIKQLFKK